MNSFKIEIKIRNCDIEFKKDLGPGIIGSKIIDIDENNIDCGLLFSMLADVERDMIDELIETQISEL